MKNQLLIFRVASTEALAEGQRTLYESDLCRRLEQGAALMRERRNLVLNDQAGSDVFSRALS